MIVVETTPGKFALTDLSTNELEAFYEALIYFEAHRLPAVDDFQVEKGRCLSMATKIDSQLILSRS